jgi:hypothetical protein
LSTTKTQLIDTMYIFRKTIRSILFFLILNLVNPDFIRNMFQHLPLPKFICLIRMYNYNALFTVTLVYKKIIEYKCRTAFKNSAGSLEVEINKSMPRPCSWHSGPVFGLGPRQVPLPPTTSPLHSTLLARLSQLP